MHQGIAVALARRGEQKARALRLGQPERVVRAERTDLQRGDGMLQIVDRRGRRGEMKDEVHVVGQEDVVRDIVLDEAVVLIPREVLDIRRAAGDEVVDANDPMALGDQAVGEM